MSTMKSPLFHHIIDSRLAKNQLISILIFSSVITLVGTFIQLFIEYKEDIRFLDAQLAQIESSHLDSLTNTLWLLDDKQMKIHLDNILSMKDIVYLEITEKGNRVYSAGTISPGKVKAVSIPMVYNRNGRDITIGTLKVHASLGNVYSRLGRRIFIIMVTQGLKTFLVSFFILVILYRQVIQHLISLSGFTRNTNLDSLDSEFRLDRNPATEPDELDLLVQQFNNMRQRMHADLDRIKTAEAALRKSEERFGLAMQFANEGLFDWHLQTDQIYFSPGWKRLLGYEDHEIENQFSEWERLTWPEDVQASRDLLNEVLSGKRNRFEKEFKMHHKDGHWVDILSRANIIFDENGRGIRVVGTHVDITAFKQAQEDLRQSEQELKAILQATPDPMVMYDTNGHPLYLNPAFSEIFGWTMDEVKGSRIPFVPEDQKEVTASKIERLFLTGRPVKFTTTRLAKQGDMVDVIISAAIIRDQEGQSRGMVVTLTDIREQKKLESQLQQAQKMESVGRLAGGVAHDFNNMLSIIMGHTELIMEDAPPDTAFTQSLQEIQTAAQRSTDLVRQLLAFARKQTVSPQVLNLNETTEGMLKMLQRLIGEDIHLTWLPSEAPWFVRVDPSQIDQILANLCVNARDAITEAGQIVIETKNVTLDQSYAQVRIDARPGEYVVLVFSDNGCGMDSHTLENLFEPFFTTKELGRGTGLGLSTIYGIVRQNNGMINVYSEPGQGTTFRIYFPRFKASGDVSEPTHHQDPVRGGNETILLVEDEKAMLRITTRMLKRLGYEVLPASNPGEALQIATAAGVDRIHLLMTDVVMPEMNGRSLSDEIRKLFPDTKCLYMSGYTANIIAHHGILDEDVVFISKPFSASDIAAKVRQILDSDPPVL